MFSVLGWVDGEGDDGEGRKVVHRVLSRVDWSIFVTVTYGEFPGYCSLDGDFGDTGLLPGWTVLLRVIF